MTGVLRRMAAVDLVFCAYAAGYLVWLIAAAAGMRPPAVVGDLAFFPLGVTVAWAAWRTSRIEGIDRRTRLGWTLVCASMLVLWFTGSAWTLSLLLHRDALYPNWIQQLFYAQYGLAVSGYLCFPGTSLTGRARTRFQLDVALVIVAGFVMAFYFSLGALFADASESLNEAMVEASLDWILFAVAAVGCIHKRDLVMRQAMALLLAGDTAYMFGNYFQSGLPSYTVGHPIDGLWLLGWMFRWAAARAAWYRYRVAGEAGSAPVQEEYRSTAFSHLMVVGAFLLMFADILSGDHPVVGVLAFSAVLMAGLLILRQIAELNENRRLLREQLATESRYTSLVRQSSDVVLLVDAAGVIAYASPAAARVFGEAAALAGTSLSYLLPPADAPAVAAILTGDADAPGRLETRMRSADGRWREVEGVWTDLRDDADVGGIVFTFRDVTQRHELERQLHHTQKLDAMGHLAGGLAHDLNNVLMVIRGYTELVRSDLPPDSPAIDDLNHIGEACERAAAVTSKVLAFSRKEPAERAVLDLNSVVRELDPMLRQFAKDRIEVEVECAPDLWPVWADRGQLEQALLNLATNARDAMPNGGVLRIATGNRAITAESPPPAGVPPGDYVALVVSDQGVGMSPEVVARIFDPFFTTKPKERGKGLGLAMTHGIVFGSNGHIVVDTAPGEGATFTVLLPRTALSAVPPAE